MPSLGKANGGAVSEFMQVVEKLRIGITAATGRDETRSPEHKSNERCCATSCGMAVDRGQRG